MVLVCFKPWRAFKFVSPSKFFVSTKHLLSSSEVDKMMRSAGADSLLRILITSPTLISFQERLANLVRFVAFCCADFEALVVISCKFIGMFVFVVVRSTLSFTLLMSVARVSKDVLASASFSNASSLCFAACFLLNILPKNLTILINRVELNSSNFCLKDKFSPSTLTFGIPERIVTGLLFTSRSDIVLLESSNPSLIAVRTIITTSGTAANPGF